MLPKRKTNSKRTIGFFTTALGSVMIIAMFLLIIYNCLQSDHAGELADEALESVKDAVTQPVQEEAKQQEDGLPAEQSDTSEMTVVEVDGYDYIGYLSIPDLELELPILSETDDIRLKTAPCRYYGSIKTDDLIIAGHNYARHFGKLYTLKEGDSVVFTDMDGNSHHYQVAQLEILTATAVLDMVEGKYPLTLYTCTFGGENRVTVRCKNADKAASVNNKNTVVKKDGLTEMAGTGGNY